MNIIELINNNLFYIILGMSGTILLLYIIIVILLIKHSRLNKKYKKFMAGANGSSLEDQIISRFQEIDHLKLDSEKIQMEIDKIMENLDITYQKIGVVKYDAFKEMGGKLSFVLALLDKNNDGIILNSVHSSREGCYTYLKEIIKGESFLELSGDEKKALDQAINSTNYMF
ncbi:MAG: DUF4446 family protein [Clostridiales bacterium]|nr:DUF4446 family protein [Clostridiales bacterium]